MPGHRRAATALGCARLPLQPGARGAGTGARKACLGSSPRRGSRPRPRVVPRRRAGGLRDCPRARRCVAVGAERGLRLQRNQRVGELRRGDGSRCLAGGRGRLVHPHRASLPGRGGPGRTGLPDRRARHRTPVAAPLRRMARTVGRTRLGIARGRSGETESPRRPGLPVVVALGRRSARLRHRRFRSRRRPVVRRASGRSRHRVLRPRHRGRRPDFVVVAHSSRARLSRGLWRGAHPFQERLRCPSPTST